MGRDKLIEVIMSFTQEVISKSPRVRNNTKFSEWFVDALSDLNLDQFVSKFYKFWINWTLIFCYFL